REMAWTGVQWTFSPVLCLARDLRWGRVGETFGEDVLLIGDMATATIHGYQGDDLAARDSVLACAKHFAGYSETQGGRDASEADLSRRQMLSTFLPAFERAAKAGAATFMTGYQAIDGLPCTANRWLLTEVLRDAWGYEGFVVTDWNNVGHMKDDQKVCGTIKDGSIRAAQAGNDMIMSTPGFYESTIEAVKSGELDEALVDQAVRRILSIKFKMGLFEDPRLPDAAKRKTIIGCPEHRKAALQAARESMVLLKNRNNLLPLQTDTIKKIAVLGPNADDAFTQLGDWSLGTGQAGEGKHPRTSVVTLLDGLQKRFPSGMHIDYLPGCDMKDPDTAEVAEAAHLAARSDLAVVAVGDNLKLTGEFKSTATLELTGGQQALLEAVKATGTPMVVVLINTKPLCLPWVAENADAVIEAFNPGMEGGTALAEIIAGDVNPSGKLTISFPHHVGQQPVHYSRLHMQHGGEYVDGYSFEPLWAFGDGMSYTTFRYGQPRLDKSEIKEGEPVTVEFELTNTGERDGVEIAQCYLNDSFTSATWSHKLLKAYQRVELKSGESQSIQFALQYDDLALIDADCNRVVEPGDFELLIGPNSRDGDLQKVGFTVK
ncbi:MAG: glycoside hydrolase family 3 C-terminal domain-containing protein, partial [Candidatus Sumerlaeota bacterium]